MWAASLTLSHLGQICHMTPRTQLPPPSWNQIQVKDDQFHVRKLSEGTVNEDQKGKIYGILSVPLGRFHDSSDSI